MRVEEKRNNENKKDESEIDVEKNAMNNNDDETIKNDYYFENLYQS